MALRKYLIHFHGATKAEEARGQDPTPKDDRPRASIMFGKVFFAAIAADVLFLVAGALQLAFSITFHQERTDPSAAQDGKEALRRLVYQRLPLVPSIVNAVLALLVFGVTIPGLLFPSERKLLKGGAYGVALCGVFTLILGLYVWIGSLRLGETFAPIYIEQEADVQSLIQQSFKCCGYYNSTSPAFITDNICPTPAAAALRRGCWTFISIYVNSNINVIFTSLFGMVGVDALFILSIACLIQRRKERERYRLIEEKTGYGHF